jgi:hypothetical protein
MPTNERTNKCKHCGQKFMTAVESGICCLLAPTPQGWCAWCGEDAPKGQTFCNATCSVSYTHDKFKGFKKDKTLQV